MVVISTSHVATPAYPDEAWGGSGLTRRSPFAAQPYLFMFSRNRLRVAAGLHAVVRPSLRCTPR
jgi:hypothetical protein